MKSTIPFCLICSMAFFILTAVSYSIEPIQRTRPGKASWYSRESCRQEDIRQGRPPRTSFLMANQQELNDRLTTCAIRHDVASALGIRYGQSVRIKNLDTGKTAVIRYTDNGPASSTRCIADLTPASFRALGGRLEEGKINIVVERVRDDKRGLSETLP